ncbi:hypothetical protein X777_08117 [Ooceraea biroi]|uniref:Odorant receptor n=1 Tax=Ooceraea biroi TaxID=2015173 RepID=A0A026WC76_OOCBI|nr:hypothetical protein X777_08117 [Ooceraea biroi]
MICIVEHFRIQRSLLFAIGVWPYNQSKYVRFQYSLFLVVTNSFIIFQLTPFITSVCTVNLIIKLLSTIVFSLVCVIHQISFWINTDVVIAVCCVFIVTLMPIYPRILSTFLLVNISRPLYNMQFVTEYFIDKEKNFYLILLHTYAFFYIAIITLVGGGMMVYAYLKHVCGLFSIASYRIEQSMILNIYENTDLRNKMIEKKIRLAVDVHRTAIELSDLFTSSFNGTYFCLMVVAVLCLCFNLYEVLETALLRDKVEEFLLHLIFASAVLLYSFLANTSGEEIIEHYNNMFSTAYNVQWYMAPIRVQKLILFLLQRSCKMYGLKTGGLFIASLEGFASLCTASVSYFTVIYSVQK